MKHFNLLTIPMLGIIALIIISSSCTNEVNTETFVYSKIPSDSDLKLTFDKNREMFDKLVQMSNEDSNVSRISYDFTWLVDDVSFPRSEDKLGFTKERWSEYKILFNKINLMSGIKRGGREVYFMAYTAGLATRGIEKGYVFSKEDLKCTSKSLDDIDNQGDRFACKEIGKDWYLYLSK